MSKEVDERIVSMQFDNKQFEEGVKTSMSTIDKLKEKLNFKGASKGLEELNRSADKVHMSGMTKAIETVHAKFSALQVIGMTALSNITNSALAAGKRITSALTIDPVKSGFQEYETQINAVQTILANTESKGTTLQQVNSALDELNHYADLTIYNFTEMTRNIGTFTAAGVDLKTSVSAIQGIANLAAVSGSNAQQASTAMYQLSQALAAGTVKLQDWNSVVNAGMGGQVFQDALKETARVHGIAIDKMIKDEGSFRETLQKGWLTSDILTETLKHFTMAAEEGTEQWKAYKKELMDTGYSEKQAEAILKMSNTATNAATKVKTFSQLWDTVNEAVQSGWTESWEIMLGDFEEAKGMFTDISNRLNDMISDSANARNSILSGGLSSGWKQLLDQGISDENGFKETIKAVAKEHGVSIDKMIKAEKKHNASLTDSEAFQNALVKSLKKGKLTSDDLSTAVYKLSKKMSKMSTAELEAAGYTTDNVLAIKELAKGLKNGSVSMDEFVSKMERSSGRENIIQSMWNSFDAVLKIIAPVKEGFRDIFPRTTGEELYNMTVALEKFTERLEISDATAGKLKRTAKGVFAVLDIGLEAIKALGKGCLTIVKSFTGFSDSALDAGASMGDMLVKLRDCIVDNDLFGKSIGEVAGVISKGVLAVTRFTKSNNILGKAVNVVTTLITKAIDAIDRFGTSTSKAKNSTNSFSGILGFLQGVWKAVTTISSGIATALSSVIQNVTEFAGKGNIFEVIDSGIFAGILLAVHKFTGNLSDALEDVGGVTENIKGILDDVRGCFKAYQDQLKAGTLMKIATAIALLAGSLFVLSTIDEDALKRALVAISLLFGELLGSLKLFTKITTSMKGVTKSISIMIAMSVSILLLASALKKISSISWEGLAKGLVGVGVLMGEILAFMKIISGFEKKAKFASVGVVLLATSILILANAVEKFGEMDWESIGKGLAGIGGLLTELVVFSNFSGKAKHIMSTGAAMVLLGASMKIFASAVKDFGSMQWETIGKGLLAMAGALTEVTVALNFMPKNMLGIGTGLLAVSAAMLVLASAFNKFGGMNWESIAKGVVAMGGALAELTIALNLMRGTASGSAALLIAAGALAILTPVLKSLGNMSWESIAKGLVMMAGAFTVIGVAGALIKPLIPTLLGLSASFALFGVSVLAIGAGLTLAATGIAALATALSVGATTIVAGISAIIIGIVNLIPQLADGFGKIIISFAKVIGDCAPQITDAVLKLISSVLSSIAAYSPQIVDSIFKILIGVINSVADNLPSLISAAVNLIGQLLKGIVDALKGVDTTNIVQGILAVGLLTALTYALAGVTALIPSAMLGLAGLTLVIAELTLVLAAIGGLSQIPGLEWLVSEGGNFLATVGYAIGQFVGSIIGGIGAGVTSGLSDIGTNLSQFIENIKPFLEGVKGLDPSSLSGVSALAKAILVLTAANIVNGIANFLTGKDSFKEFGKSIVSFGKAMVKYSAIVSGNIDAEAVTASANAGKTLAELANSLPNSGGALGWWLGNNDIDDFGEKIKPFGKAMVSYSKIVSGNIDVEAVTASANAGKALAELANNLPNSGGALGWWVGNNDIDDFAAKIKPFGKAIASYCKEVAGKVDPDAVIASTNAGKALAELANNLPNSGGVAGWFAGNNDIDDFGDRIVVFGKSMAKYSKTVSGKIDAEAVTASATAGKALAELASSLDNSGGLVSLFTGDNTIDEFGKQIVKFGKSMSEYSDNVDGINVNATRTSAQAASLLADAAKNVPEDTKKFVTFGKDAKSFGTNFAKYAKSVSDIDKTKLTAVNTSIRGLANISKQIDATGMIALSKGLSALGKANLKSFTDEFSNSKSAITAAVDKMVQNFVDAVNSKSSAAKGQGDKFAASFIDGVQSKRKNITETGKSLSTSGITGMRSKYKDFKKAGSYVAQGFTKGIEDNISAAAKAAAKMASEAEKAAKKELDIHSPSKKFKKIGEYCVEGLAKGLSNKTKTANLATTTKHMIKSGVTNTAIKQLRSMLDIRSQLKYGQGAFDAYLKYFGNITSEFMSLYQNEKAAEKAITDFGHTLYLESDQYKEDASAIAENKAQLKAYEKEKAKVDKKMKSKESEINKAKKSSYYYMKKDLKSYDSELSKAYKKQDSLNKSIEKLSKSNSKSAKSRIADLKKEKAANDATIKSIASKRNTLQKRIDKYTKYAKAEDIQSKIDSYTEQYEKETKKYKTKRDSIEAKMAKYSGKSDKKSKTQYAKLADDLKDLDKQFNKSSAGKKLVSLNKQLDALGGSATKTLKTLKKEDKSVSAELSKNLKKRESVNKQIEKLSKKTDADSKKKVKELKKTRKELDKEIETSYKKRASIEKKMAKVQAKIDKYSKDGTAASKQKVKDLKSEYNDLKQQSKDYAKSIKETNKAIKQSTDDMLQHEIEVWNEYKETISTALKETLDPLKQSIDTQIDLFSKFGSDEEIAKSDILTNMESQLNGVEQWSKHLELLAGRGISKGLLQKLRDMGPESANYVKAFMNMTDSELKAANMMFERTTNLTASTLLDGMSDSLSAVKEWGDNMVELSKKGLNQDVLKSLAEQGVSGADYVKAFLSMTPEQVKEFNRMYASTLRVPDSVADEVAASVAHASKTMNTGFINAFKNDSKALESAIANVVKKAARSTSSDDVLKSASGSGKKVSSAVGKGIEAKRKNVMSTASKFGSSIKNSISTILTYSAGSATAVNFCSGLLTAIQNAVSQAEKAASSSTSGKKTESSMKKVGENAAKGLAKGTSSKKSKKTVAKGATVMTGILVSVTKKNLKQHSPSRVFYEIGEYTVQGLVNGLHNNVGMVSASAEELSKQVVDSAAAMVKHISDYVTDGVDLQPVITPVLNTSDLEAGSRRIDALFNKAQALRIADGMNNSSSSQNGVVNNSNPKTNSGNSYQLIQNNYSPKALSRIDIYRQTKNQFSALKEVLGT